MDSSSFNGFIAGLAIAYVIYLNNEINMLKQSSNDSKKSDNIIDIDPIHKQNNQHSVLTGFKQIGLLKSEQDDKSNIIIPLFAKNTLPTTIYHTHVHYDTQNWKYYTISHDNGLIIPLDIDKNDCMTDEGCRELHNNDIIYISMYKSNFKVKIYNIDMLHHE